MSNKMLLYVTQESIKKYNQNIGDMYETPLYKLLYLVQRELSNKGIDLKYPYYWYLYGPMMDVLDFSSQTGVDFNSRFHASENWKNQKKKIIRNPSIDMSFVPYQDELDVAIDIVMNSVDKKTPSQSLIRSAYESAPYSFQRNFKHFDELIYYGDFETSQDIFYNLIMDFPKIDFEDVYYLFLEWQSATELAFDIEKYDVIRKLNTHFWHAFCCKLSNKQNQHLSDFSLRRIKSNSDRLYSDEERMLYETSESLHCTLNVSDFSEQTHKDVAMLNKLMLEDFFEERSD